MDHKQEITLTDRTTLRMSGVGEVLSFDEKYVLVGSSEGKIEIEGEDLKILHMAAQDGNFLLTGRVDGIFFAKDKKARFLKKG
ncbi:MAG: YabP/YqfC family sporulation protein [Clostridia bacterium]|nr:YabP/YqfC family sporulation protein [Clostridia bacterium]